MVILIIFNQGRYLAQLLFCIYEAFHTSYVFPCPVTYAIRRMMNHIPGIRVVPLYELGYALNLLGLRQAVVERYHIPAVALCPVASIDATAFDAYTYEREALAYLL